MNTDQGALFTDPPAEVRAKRTYVLAPERTEAEPDESAEDEADE